MCSLKSSRDHNILPSLLTLYSYSYANLKVDYFINILHCINFNIIYI